MALASPFDTVVARLGDARRHVVCLQDLKTLYKMFPVRMLANSGYAPAWPGQKTRRGVAIPSRIGDPVATRTRLPGDPNERCIEAAIGGLIIASICLPHGNPQPGQKFDPRLAWSPGCGGTRRDC
ncbi:MAG: hypothetical protein ABL956_09290 [Hyphomonadaceae bacterium]